MTVALAMIVKDEENVIEACLDSAIDHIDAWTILDTGSTDATPKIISKRLRDLPGKLHHGDFRGFGATRTQLMALARGTADYLMLLDADMQIVYDGGDLPSLTAEVYEGRIKTTGIDYALPILVRDDRDWRYEGVAHSYLAADQGYDSEVLPGLWIIDGSSTGPEKLRRDLELLSAEHARNPLDARTAFYLAQTYFDLDMIPEAIAAYRARVSLDGWAEETYYARYRLGSLLCEHVSFAEGAKELLAAWESRPTRTEALRVLSNVSSNVADKIPYPDDKLFVRPSAYAAAPVIATPVVEADLPPLPSIAPARARRQPKIVRGKLAAADVSAVIVTRGNVDLDPILATLPYKDIVIWDNSVRVNYKTFGRYTAIPETKNPVIYWQDDDIVFTAHDELLAAYEPGKVIVNMDLPWITACGYGDFVAMMGAGSLCDATLPAEVFARYLEAHPFDDDLLVESDFAFGVLAPAKRVDLGYEPREFTDDPDRLYQQLGQHERKWKMISRCLEMLEP